MAARAPRRGSAGGPYAQKGARGANPHPGARCSSPVGIARPPPITHAALAMLPTGAAGALNLDHGHRCVPEFGVESLDDTGCQELQLLSPSGRIGAHQQDTVGQRLRRRMRPDLGAHDLRPPPEDTTHSQIQCPASILDQPADLGSDALGVAPVRMCATELGLVFAATTPRAAAASARSTTSRPASGPGAARARGSEHLCPSQVQAVGAVPGLSELSCRTRFRLLALRPRTCPRVWWLAVWLPALWLVALWLVIRVSHAEPPRSRRGRGHRTAPRGRRPRPLR